MIWPNQRVKIIHSASVGFLCIPDSQRDWIFHLHTRLFSNVTHTSLKQHCHSLLASSIFPFWRFLFCEVHKYIYIYIYIKKGEGNILVIFSHQGRKQQSRVLFCWQKYWVAFLCGESTLIAFWYRYIRITKHNSKLLAITNYVASLNNTRSLFTLPGTLKMKCLFS